MRHYHGMCYERIMVAPEKIISLNSVEFLEQDIIELLDILSETQTECV